MSYIVHFYKAQHVAKTFLWSGTRQDATLSEGQQVATAGRVMLRRTMGRLTFITLRDGSGDVQLYLDREVINAQSEDEYRSAMPQSARDLRTVLLPRLQASNPDRWSTTKKKVSNRGSYDFR